MARREHRDTYFSDPVRGALRTYVTALYAGWGPRKSRVVRVADEVWDGFLARIRALHRGSETVTDQAIDDTVEAALMFFIGASQADVQKQMTKVEYRQVVRNYEESAARPA